MLGRRTAQDISELPKLGGLAAWIWSRLGPSRRPRPHLALLERITLAPRQSLAMIEADGRRFLVATSAEGSPAFYPLDGAPRLHGPTAARARVSW